MRTRAFVLFWGSTVASALLLGSIWTLKDRAGSTGFRPREMALLAMAGVGFCATLLVAARIAYVVGRIKKLQRTERSGEV